MFDLQHFKKRLGETIAWYELSIATRDDKTLWNLLPPSVNDLGDYDLLMRLVEPVCEIRSALLESKFRVYQHWKKPVPALPSGLSGGRLLAFYPGVAVWDPAAGAASEGYFNNITAPAWDSWVYFGTDRVSFKDSPSDFDYLICWIPP